MCFDAAAFCGHWPYYYLRDGQLSQVRQKLWQGDIDGGLISSLDAIFYNDPWEADGMLLEELAGTNWRLAMCINPMLPWAESLLRKGKAAGAYAVRLYPCVHGYKEDDERAIAICRLAGQLEMPVIVTMRIEDIRMTYLMKEEDPDCVCIRNLVTQCEGTNFILSNCMTHQVGELLPLPRNVWFDTAGFKGEFYLEQQQEIAQDRILFGSFAPLQCLTSALLCVPDAKKQAIMQENIKELYK